MLANILKDRVAIQVRTATLTSLGETVIWKPVQKLYARVIPLDAKARAVYQQTQSQVTHKILLRGNVSLELADNRFLWGDKTLEPVGPSERIAGNTVILAREI